MDRNIKVQDELVVVNRTTENEATSDYLHDIDSLINEHNRLYPHFSSHQDIPQDIIGEIKLVGDILVFSLADESKNRQDTVSNNTVELMSPLHIAALQGNVDVLRNLIDHGADVYAKDIHGCTALRIAAQKGDYNCLKMLIEAGADAFASSNMPYKAAAFRMLVASALITALQHNHIDCVQELLQYGVDYKALDESGYSFRYTLAQKAICKCASLTTDKIGICALSMPPTYNHSLVDCTDKLLLIGSFDNHIKINGISDLPAFMSTGIEDVDAEIFKVFVLESYCIDRNIPRGLTTLQHLGFEYYNSKIASILITCFADIVIKDGLSNINPVEYLLNTSGRFEALKFIVKCIPWVLHIKLLTTLPFANKLPNHQFYDENSETFVLPPNVAFALECDQTCIYVAIHDREKELAKLELTWYDIIRGTPKYGRYPLKQSLINLIDERISDEIDQLNLIIEDELYELPFNAHLIKKSYHSELVKLKKYLWCVNTASNPPTLMQCCRYSVLKYLGPLNMENIRKLPLPNKLQSYLLFQ